MSGFTDDNVGKLVETAVGLVVAAVVVMPVACHSDYARDAYAHVWSPRQSD